MNYIYLVERHPLLVHYDQVSGFVIVAKNVTQARAIAAQQSTDEGEEVWFNYDKSSCTLMGQALTGCRTGVIMFAFKAG